MARETHGMSFIFDRDLLRTEAPGCTMTMKKIAILVIASETKQSPWLESGFLQEIEPWVYRQQKISASSRKPAELLGMTVSAMESNNQEPWQCAIPTADGRAKHLRRSLYYVQTSVSRLSEGVQSPQTHYLKSNNR